MTGKKWLKMLTAGVLAAMCLVGCGDDKEEAVSSSKVAESEATASPQIDTSENNNTASEGLLSGKHHVEIEVKDYGTIKVELDADTAPITTTNFINLAKEGFYDGLTFHRIISGFMIQGGDPNGDGTGGSDNNIKGEFEENGVKNNISHTRGVISMARAGGDPDSASSQFFIMHADAANLDGQYAAFGHVTEGMEIVDKICEQVKPADKELGTVAREEQPVITAVRAVD